MVLKFIQMEYRIRYFLCSLFYFPTLWDSSIVMWSSNSFIFFFSFLPTRKKYWPKRADLLNTFSAHELYWPMPHVDWNTLQRLYFGSTQIISFWARDAVGRESMVPQLPSDFCNNASTWNRLPVIMDVFFPFFSTWNAKQYYIPRLHTFM